MKCTLTYKAKSFVISIPEDGIGALLFDEASKQTKIAPKRTIIVYNKNGDEIPINKDTKIKDIGVSTFIVKDAGLSLDWKTVFLLAYLGPFSIAIAFVLLLGDKLKWNCYFTIGFIMWELHYVKRAYEAISVHAYSQSLMPFIGVMKNVVNYWGFTLLITYNMYKRSQTIDKLELCQIIAIPLWFVSECLNFYCHYTLAHLRPKGSKERFLPKGFLFNRITSPNYTFEISGCIFFAVYTRLITAVIFATVGGSYMLMCAHQKRKSYIKRWPEAKNRGRITPFTFL